MHVLPACVPWLRFSRRNRIKSATAYGDGAASNRRELPPRTWLADRIAALGEPSAGDRPIPLLDMVPGHESCSVAAPRNKPATPVSFRAVRPRRCVCTRCRPLSARAGWGRRKTRRQAAMGRSLEACGQYSCAVAGGPSGVVSGPVGRGGSHVRGEQKFRRQADRGRADPAALLLVGSSPLPHDRLQFRRGLSRY